jgi:hypothetical protein
MALTSLSAIAFVGGSRLFEGSETGSSTRSTWIRPGGWALRPATAFVVDPISVVDEDVAGDAASAAQCCSVRTVSSEHRRPRGTGRRDRPGRQNVER